MTAKELNEIESRLKGYKNYGDIPVKFIYLKSLLDMKQEESRY